MTRKKTPKADVRRWYHLYLEFGLVAALFSLIVAFRVDFNPKSDLQVQLQEQEVISLDELPQTRQVEKPPPPPAPPAPVEVPDTEVLEEETFEFDAEINFEEPVDIPPPPPAPVREEVKEEEPEIFIVVEQMPELIGGIQAIQQHLQYPEIANRAGIEGMVVVQFVVDEQGNAIDLNVVRSLGGGCDEEAIRVITKYAKFKPGKQRGKPVRVRFSIPVRFLLKN